MRCLDSATWSILTGSYVFASACAEIGSRVRSRWEFSHKSFGSQLKLNQMASSWFILLLFYLMLMVALTPENYTLSEDEGGLVSYPSRWSLLFIFGFMWWSSSWQWLPHIAGGKMFTSLLRAGLTVLVQFFCKMYFLYVSWGCKKNLATFFSFFSPPKNGW